MTRVQVFGNSGSKNNDNYEEMKNSLTLGICVGISFKSTSLHLVSVTDLLRFPVKKSDFNQDDTIVFCLGGCEPGRS
jgi:hypothetical protein